MSLYKLYLEVKNLSCYNSLLLAIMDAECDCNEKFCCYVGLPVMGILVLTFVILAVVTIILFLKQKSKVIIGVLY